MRTFIFFHAYQGFINGVQQNPKPNSPPLLTLNPDVRNATKFDLEGACKMNDILVFFKQATFFKCYELVKNQKPILTTFETKTPAK